MLTLALTTLALLSGLLLLWQWIAALRFPLHRIAPAPKSVFLPSVTVFKPLKGNQARILECVESWLKQKYPSEIQYLFGVVSPQDPIVKPLLALFERYEIPGSALVICSEARGANRKVSTLIQLERHIRHEIVVISDADVLVPEDFVQTCVQEFRDEQVDLAHCFYCMGNPHSLAMRWEAIAMNADFWSQVTQSQTIKAVDFALGAVMAVRRSALERIGGFSVLKDYLADDFHLGRKIHATGGKIVLHPTVVTCLESKQGWKEIWCHQLRWARTIRVSQPWGYFGTILCNATLWSILLILLVWEPWALVLGCSLLVFRIYMAVDLQMKLSRSKEAAAFGWMVPVKDCLQLGIWLAAFIGNRVSWRGEDFRVLRSGLLEKEGVDFSPPLPLGEPVGAIRREPDAPGEGLRRLR